MLEKIKQNILTFGMWAQANWLALVILLTVYWMFFLCIISLSWLYGYWSNPLFGTKFEIASCWTGIGATIAAFATIVGLAGVSWAKYHTDSKFNSEENKPVDFSILNKFTGGK
jgi:hypothetical protein